MVALVEDIAGHRAGNGAGSFRALLEHASKNDQAGVWRPMRPWSGEALLGTLIATRPTVELLVERPEGTLGLCIVDGRILAAAREGTRLCDHPVLAHDPALKLILEMWAAPTRELDPRTAMRADLEFTCEYDRLFAQVPGFADHLVDLVSSLLPSACTAVHVGPHSPSEHGLPAGDIALRVFMRMTGAARRGRIGPSVLHGPETIPGWLRGTLPPAKFGRLFFALADGATLSELTRARLDPDMLESAILLGLVADVLERTEEHDVAPPVGQLSPTSSASCGTTAAFLATLRAVADQSRSRQKRTRLTGTRFEPVGLVAGDLRVYYAIGEGAYGTVDIATLTTGPLAGRIVAAKRLRHEHLDKPDIVRRFTAEAELLSLMRHPHVVGGFGILHHDPEHFILMELVHGVTLGELLRALQRHGQTLPEPLVRHIGAAIALGLVHVHGQLGTVHRDVAPPNILLSFSGDVKLADFSTAQGDDPRLAPERRGARSGRLGYMSPESLVHPPTTAADEYALGACLYEAVTGHKLIEAESQAETLQAVVKGTHVPVLELAPTLSPPLAYHIERAVSPSPHDRHASLAAFAEALKKGLTGQEPAALVALLDELFGATAARETEALARIRRELPCPPPLPGASA